MSHSFSNLGRVLALCALAVGCGGGAVDEDGPGLDAVATRQAELSSDCTGIRPAGPGPRTTVSGLIGADRDCLAGTSDRLGHMALATFDPFSEVTTWHVIPVDGGAGTGFMEAFRQPEIFPSISAFQTLQVYPDATAYLLTWNHNGTLLSSQRLDRGAADTDRMFDMAGDYGGGVVFAYASRSNTGNHHVALTVQRFFQDGPARHDPVFVTQSLNAPAFFAAGVNYYRNTLIIYDGIMEGMPFGHIAAAWFDPSGNRLTPAFDVGTLASPSASHTLKLFPLYDGRMALRVDGTWTLAIPMSPGAGAAVPSWLASHPDTTPHFIRGLRGYALVPPSHESMAACYQRFLLYAQNGNYCGSVTFGIDSAACTTHEIELGNDGTVIQQSPRDTCSGGACTCTRYVYPRVLQ